MSDITFLGMLVLTNVVVVVAVLLGFVYLFFVWVFWLFVCLFLPLIIFSNSLFVEQDVVLGKLSHR